MDKLANERNNSLISLKTVKYLRTLNILNVKQVKLGIKIIRKAKNNGVDSNTIFIIN